MTIEPTSTGFVLKTPISINYYDTTNNRSMWEVCQTAEGTNFKTERFGNTIKLISRFKHKQANKEYAIDSRPWCQYPEVTLQEFARSDNQKHEFWIISSNDLALFEFQAIKKDKETIKISGSLIETIHIRIKAIGFAKHFWHADYWFTRADGSYIRYQAIHGGPGTPATIKELAACDR